MIKVNNTKLLNNYKKQFNINDIFSIDMNPYMELVLFKKNEYICKEQEKLSHLFFMVEGKAKVFTLLSNGKSLLMCFNQGFNVIGELEITNQFIIKTNVQAIEDVYCIAIPSALVQKYLLEDTKFLKYICNSLGKKLDDFSKNSSINLLYPLENRLASYILATSERSKSIGQEKLIFSENLTELSGLLGTSYRHLLRTLNSLCDNKIIEKNNTKFNVVNEAALRKMASDLYK
ncbi:MAG: cyclic nucleotide-binding protein [Clostridiales bacterium]|jgi:CRP-like cAMP-binding protein|nr:cyclic nucleotide-binding protein [Clostridiales bacterium]